MSSQDISIVWPAPGSPALLDCGQTTLTVIVVYDSTGHDELRDWLCHLRLVDRDGGAAWPLQLIGVREIPRSELPPCAAAFGNLPDNRQRQYAECMLALDAPIQPASPRTSMLFDLAAGERLLRARCVAALSMPAGRLSVAFACDIHFAAFWRDMVAAVHRHAPDLSSRVLDPSLMWKLFVDEMNALWRRGAVDLLVLGGDLVESVHPRDEHDGGIDAATNVHEFHDQLNALRIPSFVIPGNHDYRMFPWRPRVFGLQSIGLRPEETRRVLQSAGMWERAPLRLNDLRALHTRDGAGRHALTHHLHLLAPGTDYAVTVGGMRLVFASTGADVMVRWRSMQLSRVPRFLRSLLNAWNDPDSEGFYDGQLDRIIANLNGVRGAALFFHAPLLHYEEADLVEPAPVPQMVAAGEIRDVAVERRERSVESRHGICFHNGHRLLEHLHATSGSMTTFSGHIHRASRMEIDRQSRQVRAVEMTAPITGNDAIRLLVGPALCQKHRDERASPPGYLLAHFADGQLARLEQIDLRP